MGILVAVSERCISERIVRVSFDLDDRRRLAHPDVENHFLYILHCESQRL